MLLEVRTPNGKERIYAVSQSEKVARMEARKMIAKFVHDGQDDRVLWKLSCDRDWSMGAARPLSQSRKLFKMVDEAKVKSKIVATRLVNYFFDETPA